MNIYYKLKEEMDKREQLETINEMLLENYKRLKFQFKLKEYEIVRKVLADFAKGMNSINSLFDGDILDDNCDDFTLPNPIFKNIEAEKTKNRASVIKDFNTVKLTKNEFVPVGVETISFFNTIAPKQEIKTEVKLEENNIHNISAFNLSNINHQSRLKIRTSNTSITNNISDNKDSLPDNAKEIDSNKVSIEIPLENKTSIDTVVSNLLNNSDHISEDEQEEDEEISTAKNLKSKIKKNNSKKETKAKNKKKKPTKKKFKDDETASTDFLDLTKDISKEDSDFSEADIMIELDKKTKKKKNKEKKPKKPKKAK